jgi:hypothetical protein
LPQELKNTLRTTKAGMHFMQMKFHEEFNSLGRYSKKKFDFFVSLSTNFSFWGGDGRVGSRVG